MSLIGSLLLLFGGIALFYVLLALGRLLDRKRGSIILTLVLPLLLFTAAVLGGSLYLDHNGIDVPAVIVDKKEEISIYDTGVWARNLAVVITYQARGMASQTESQISVDASLYDQMHIGGAVEVRYIAVRLTSSSSSSSLMIRMTRLWEWTL